MHNRQGCTCCGRSRGCGCANRRAACPTGPTGPTGPGGGGGGTIGAAPLFAFAGLLDTETVLDLPADFANDGTALAVPEVAPIGPFPAYPVAQATAVSSLAVTVGATAPITEASLVFQLVRVAANGATGTPIGNPVTFAPGSINVGNQTLRTTFATETFAPEERIALRATSPDGLSIGSTLFIAATAG